MHRNILAQVFAPKHREPAPAAPAIPDLMPDLDAMLVAKQAELAGMLSTLDDQTFGRVTEIFAGITSAIMAEQFRRMMANPAQMRLNAIKAGCDYWEETGEETGEEAGEEAG